MDRCLSIVTATLMMLFVLGCGSSGPATSPDLYPGALSPSLTGVAQAEGVPMGHRVMWGLWEIILDTRTMQFQIVPLRGVEYTVDAVAFLQYPKGKPTNLQVDMTDLSQWHTKGIMEVDVGLTHPFPGLDQFAGFDVMGAFIGSGSVVSSHSPGVRYRHGGDDPVILNPDGYTRWFNPTEFTPDGTILRFVPGNLGEQDLSLVDATVNGYKYFADGLDKDADLYAFLQNPANLDMRGQFRPGSLNSRHYTLQFPMVGGEPNLVFQYAVIANWVPPDPTASGDPDVIDIPGDYPISANAAESFYCHVADNSTLWYTDSAAGGDLALSLEVFDWAGYFNPGSVADEIAAIRIENQTSLIPGGAVTFSGPTLVAMPGTTSASSVFNVEIADCSPWSVAGQEVLITIEQTHGAFAPNPDLPPVVPGPLTSHVFHTLNVLSYPPGNDFAVIDPNGGEFVPMTLSYDILWEPGPTPTDTVKIEYSKDDFVSDIHLIAADAPNTGTYTWDPVPIDPTTTAKVRITEPAPGMDWDISDDYFTIKEPVWFEFQPSVAVEEAGVSWHYSWGYDPKDELSPCISEDTEGELNVTYYCWEKTQDVYTSDINVKSTNGDTWQGIANYFGTVVIIGDPWCTRGDYLKTAPNNIGSAYASIIHNPTPMPFWSSSVDRMVLWEYNDYSFDCGASVLNNCEIGCDSLGHFYFFSDNDSPPSGISCKRCPHENMFGTAGGPTGMEGATTDTVTSDGEISHVRSWGRDGDGMLLAFYNLVGEVRLAGTTDPPNNVTWDSGTVIFDGTGYTEIRDPGMFVDSTGRVHICFVGLNQSTGLYDLLYTRADSPDDPFMPPVVAATSADPINDAHICFQVYDEYPVVGIVFETGRQIRSVLCAREDGTIFLPYQQMTEDGSFNADCDFWFTLSATYKYDSLIVYDTREEPSRRIVLQNANVGTL
jgi:hypothetical protein